MAGGRLGVAAVEFGVGALLLHHEHIDAQSPDVVPFEGRQFSKASIGDSCHQPTLAPPADRGIPTRQ